MGSSFLTSTWFFSQPLFWSARRGSQQDGHVSPGRSPSASAMPPPSANSLPLSVTTCV